MGSTRAKCSNEITSMDSFLSRPVERHRSDCSARRTGGYRGILKDYRAASADSLRIFLGLARRSDAAPLHNASRGIADGSTTQMRRQPAEIKARIAAAFQWASRGVVERPYLQAAAAAILVCGEPPTARMTVVRTPCIRRGV